MPTCAFSIHCASVSASFKQGITIVTSIVSVTPKNLPNRTCFGERTLPQKNSGSPSQGNMTARAAVGSHFCLPEMLNVCRATVQNSWPCHVKDTPLHRSIELVSDFPNVFVR